MTFRELLDEVDRCVERDYDFRKLPVEDLEKLKKIKEWLLNHKDIDHLVIQEDRNEKIRQLLDANKNR